MMRNEIASKTLRIVPIGPGVILEYGSVRMFAQVSLSGGPTQTLSLSFIGNRYTDYIVEWELPSWPEDGYQLHKKLVLGEVTKLRGFFQDAATLVGMLKDGWISNIGVDVILAPWEELKASRR